MIPADDRLKVAVALLERLGYDSGEWEHDYPVWTGSGVVRLDFVTFGAKEPRDMTTATIAALVPHSDSIGVDDALAGARALAAPALLVIRPEDFELWPVSSDESTQLEPKRGLWSEFDRLSPELAPKRLMAAKRAHRQLALFPVDLALTASTRRNRARDLAARIAEALVLVGEQLPNTSSSERSRMVIGALTALMVRDKLGRTGSDDELTADIAKARFPAYFSWIDGLDAAGHTSFVELIELLGNGVNYRGLDPAIVSDVYEHALVDRETRITLSVFYTPPELARVLVERTPFESLPPEDRTVLDPACGSGTLLLAAQDRLRELVPNRIPFDETHRYLTKHIFGLDADAFAVEIARLSLLLNALPIGNSWSVHQQPISDGIPSDLPPINFVLSNPPWVLGWTEGERRHTAEQFVRASVERVASRGYVSLLLPASLFEGRAGATTRSWLAERASVVDVTRLPEDTFASSRVETASVILQRDGTRSFYSFRRSTSGADWKHKLYKEGVTDVSRIVSSGRGLPSDLLAHGPIDGRALEHTQRLDDVARVITGPVNTPGFSEEDRAQGRHRWLRKAGSMPFLQEIRRDETDRTTYPTGFNWRTGDGSEFAPRKVLVSAVSNPSNPYRLKVRIDSLGVIPRQSLRAVVPQDPDVTSVEALAVYLASTPVAIWIDQQNASRSIRQGVLASTPVPVAQSFWSRLGKLATTFLGQTADSSAEMSQFMRQVDEFVMDEIGLTDTAKRAIVDLASGYRGPEGGIRYSGTSGTEVQTDGDLIKTTGAVLAIDESAIQLWVAGVTPSEGLSVPMPERFPGALLEVGATFDVTLRGGALDSAQYKLQRFSWADEAELIERAALPGALPENR